jgi:hypothetical protein
MLDPYHKWLGIPREPRPPSYYQMLGVDPRETDPEVLEEMAIRQTSHVRTYQTGPHAEECRCLLNEIAQARRILLDPTRRRVYDQGRRRAEGVPVAAAPPVSVAVASASTAAWVAVPERPADSGFPDLPVPIRRRLGRHPWHGVLALVVAVLLFAAGGLVVWQLLGEAAASSWLPDGPRAATGSASAPEGGTSFGREATKHDSLRKQRQGVPALSPARGGGR